MTHATPSYRPAIEKLENRQLFEAGDFDPTFGGGDGFDSFQFPSQFQLNAIYDSAVQTDGKTLLAGRIPDGTGGFDFAVARLNADGTPDSSFAFGGIFFIPFPGVDEQASGVAVQADGKIVASGQVNTGLGDGNFLVLRLNPDGSIDESFGAGQDFGVGGAIIPTLTDPFAGLPHDEARDVVIQPDDQKIVVVGAAGTADGRQAFAVARFNPDGSFDTTFGDVVDFFGTRRGFTTVDLAGDIDVAFGVALQPDGHVVATGTTSNNFQFLTARLTPQGDLDFNFGFLGIVSTAFPAPPGVTSLSIGTLVTTQTDGKIIVGGIVITAPTPTTFGFDFNVGLVRYNPDGSPDDSFGSGGTVETDFGLFEAPTSILIDNQNRILVAGKATDSPEGAFDIAVISRYTPTGQLDPNFSDDGRVVVRASQFGGAAAAAPGAPASIFASATAGEQDLNRFTASSNVTLQMVQGGGVRAQFVLGQTLNVVQLTGDAPPTPQAGDLAISFTPLNRPFNVGEAGSLTVTITNNGQGTVTASPLLALLFSTDAVVDAADIALAQTALALNLAPGQSTQATINFTTPNGLTAGNYNLVGRINGDRAANESNFDNNDAATPHTVTVPAPPTASVALAGATRVKRGKSVKFTATIRNLTQLTLTGSMALALQVADSSGNNPQNAANKNQRLKLKRNKTQKVTLSYKVPKTLAPGTYTVILTANGSTLNPATTTPIRLTRTLTVT